MSYSPLISEYRQGQETTRLNFFRYVSRNNVLTFPSAAPSIIPEYLQLQKIENLCKLQFRGLVLKL
jgi:hypothetical protein